MTTPSQACPTTITTSTSNGLPMTWPPTSSGGKRRRHSVPHAEAAVERTDMADDNHKRRKRRAAHLEAEAATATSSITAGMNGLSDAADGSPSVDDNHRELSDGTAATKALAEPDAGSPISALPAEMLHAVLARVDDLDLPACIFVCLGWAQTIAGRAAHAARALLPRRVLSQRLAAEGRLGALQWARLTLHIPWDAATCSMAARGGHLALLQWARANGCPWDEQLSWAAAVGGRLDVLEWATTEGYAWDHGLVCDGAGAAGNLHVLEWSLACRPGDDFSPSMPLGGSRPGHAAALHGHLEVLQWLHARGCPLDAITCASAARGGHLEVLQWARLEKGCQWDDRTCVQAARGGHLALLQWAHANGCPWDEHTCLMAAAYGDLDILQWARANGCPWDERTCLMAAAYGHLPALRWARQSGCPLDEWTCAQMYNAAIGWGYTDVAAWLEANEGSDVRVWDRDDVVELQADIGKMAVRAEGWLFFQ